MSESIVEITRSFDAPPLNVEQAERLQAIRKAAASFAAILHSALPPSVYRDLSIDGLRQVMALSSQAIAIERPAAARGATAVEQRIKLLADLAGRVTPTQASKLAALLGVGDPAPKRRGKADEVETVE